MSQTNTIENHRGYKETKLGWIPEDWEVLKVDEVFRFLGTNSFSRSSLFYSDSKLGTRNIHYGDIHSTYTEALLNGSNYEIIPVIKEEEKLSQNNDLLIDGDLLIADASEDYEGVGKAIELKNIEGLNILAGLHTFALRDQKQKTIKGFRSYIFLNEKVRNELKRIATGSKVYGISKSNLKKFEVIVPSLPEQKSIANCLSTWDTAITKLTVLTKAKQQQKKALAQQLLTGKKRLKGFSKGWKENRLSNFIEYTPRAVEKPQEAFTKLGIRSHCKGTFHNENFEPKNIAITTLFEVKQHDLIVNITFAWEGAIAIVKNKDNGSLVSHRFPTYIFKENISSYLFFEQFIKTKKFRYLLELISPGGAGRNRVMSKKEFIKLKVDIPEYEEQTAIAQILNTADKEITLLQQQLIQLKLQKKGIMQQLLTGKKRLI